MIKLPHYGWFLGNIPFRGDGNIFSGSAGCDAYYGNIKDKTFRYRVWLNKVEDGFELVAAHYNGEYSYEATDKSIITERTFAASAEGINEAEIWLDEAQNNAIKSFQSGVDN